MSSQFSTSSSLRTWPCQPWSSLFLNPQAMVKFLKAGKVRISQCGQIDRWMIDGYYDRWIRPKKFDANRRTSLTIRLLSSWTVVTLARRPSSSVVCIEFLLLNLFKRIAGWFEQHAKNEIFTFDFVRQLEGQPFLEKENMWQFTKFDIPTNRWTHYTLLRIATIHQIRSPSPYTCSVYTRVNVTNKHSICRPRWRYQGQTLRLCRCCWCRALPLEGYPFHG